MASSEAGQAERADETSAGAAKGPAPETSAAGVKAPQTRPASTPQPLDATAVIRSVWEDYDDEEYRQDQSHWRGVGRWKDDDAWQAIGKKSLKRLELLTHLYRFQSKLFNRELTVMEWGPGGGANMFAFRHVARRYYGVDISQKNLDEAQRMITQEGYGGFSPILLEGSPDSLPSVEPVDFFLSTAVFQHFPNKDYGRSVLKALRKSCMPSAVGFIQIRYNNGNPKYKGDYALKDYATHHIHANSYAIDEFWALVGQTGFEPLFCQEINSANNYATFYLRAR